MAVTFKFLCKVIQIFNSNLKIYIIFCLSKKKSTALKVLSQIFDTKKKKIKKIQNRKTPFESIVLINDH